MVSLALVSIGIMAMQVLTLSPIGVAYVTQCPLMPGEKFTYKFSTDDNQAGTYWYHSHFDLQVRVSIVFESLYSS